MHDVQDYWDACYASGKDFRILSHQSISRLLTYVDAGAPKTCLDIGCGTGQLTRELVHRGYTCTGVDVSEQAIASATSLTVSAAARYLRLDMERDGLEPLQRYSLITCKYVYAFIKDKPRFLTRVATLLHSGGAFVIITPLLSDVPAEKRSIAVDFDETLAALRAVFASVETFPEHGATCFVCTAPTRQRG